MTYDYIILSICFFVSMISLASIWILALYTHPIHRRISNMFSLFETTNPCSENIDSKYQSPCDVLKN